MPLSGQIVEVRVPRREVSFGSDSGRCSTRRLGAKRSVVVMVDLGSRRRRLPDDRCDEISIHHPLAAERLGSQGRVVATDIALPMLEIARAKPVSAGAARIEYLQSLVAALGAP